MRLFGILLIVFNLLAGAGFVYLATQDWSGRQAITAAALRHILLLQGLPLEGADFSAEDETPFVVEMGGGESTRTVSKKLLESYFQANTTSAPPTAQKVALAVNTPVTNQIAEVRRVQGLIKSKLGESNLDARDRLNFLRGWLLFQAENYQIRQQYLTLGSLVNEAGQPKTAEQLRNDAASLEAILEARFEAVLAKPAATDSPAATTPSDGQPQSDIDRIAKSAEWRAGPARDSIERHARLAHLLVHLDTDAAWQQRVMVVVGMRRYVRAITVQVNRFVDMIKHVDMGIPDDQAVYTKTEIELRDKAMRNAERAQNVAQERAKLVEQKTVADDAVSRWQTQLKSLTDQYNKVKAEVDVQLVRQTGIEQQLFEVQREVALTLEVVYRLEALLTNIERERYGMPPNK